MSDRTSNELPLVVVMGDMNWGYARGVWAGVCRYARRNNPWNPRREIGWLPHEAVRRFKPAGLIAHFGPPCDAAYVRSLGIPLVNVSGFLPDMPGVACVRLDDERIGQFAAQHLLDLRVRHFLFCGSEIAFSERRRQGFIRELAKAGMADRVANITTSSPASEIAKYPRPVGVFAANDAWALAISDLCLSGGLRVPEDVAIIGVDDDEAICLAAHRPLTSVPVHSERIGFEAAKILDQMMQGMPPPAGPVLFSPGPVVVRASTDLRSVADNLVAEAMRIIHERCDEQINVKTLVEMLPVSRTGLTVRFVKALGQPPAEMIRQVRVARAKQLLVDPRQSMLDVALSCGFASASRLSKAFKAATGTTPSEYRRQFLLRDE